MKKAVVVIATVALLACCFSPVMAGSAKLKYTGHHDYNIYIWYTDGRYDDARLSIRVRTKHLDTLVTAKLKVEYWDSTNFQGSRKHMVDYGEILMLSDMKSSVSDEVKISLGEIIDRDYYQDNPAGFILIEVKDGHSTHTYMLRFEMDKRQVDFSQQDCYCNVSKYWGDGEFVFFDKFKSEIYCK